MEYSGRAPFEVKIIDEILTVHPQEDGSYQVFRGDTPLATFTSHLSESGVTWETDDFIASDYVQQIGEMIEIHRSLP
jgi:hypothetical protein